ncbi:MAG: right-handed parallel beta-helix repeat-containing protein [Clostridia bacterium]|nr:right-handed parallel beta-helix repeat-containing protein [Clostridia bacterium]
MNELSILFSSIKSDEKITLKENYIYDVKQDDSFDLTGYFCTNTARKSENRNGQRYVAVYLKNKKNIVIDGNGAIIMIHGKMTPFLFDNCENITVKNLVVDYYCPTMSEFTVLENNNGLCKIKINDECLYEVKRNNLIFKGETGLNGKPYWNHGYITNKRHYKLLDPETKLFRDFLRKDMEFTFIKDSGNNILQCELKNKEVYLPKNSIIQTRSIVRDQTGALFNRCKNLYFENLRVEFMHGLGMVSQFCENVTYINCDFTPKENRTAASTADFFQFSGCKGDLLLDNIKASGAHDDYINVHGTHLRVVRKNKRNNTITVRFMHHESWGFQAFQKGDELEFIRWDTLIPYAKTRVIDYKRLNDTDIRLYLDRPLPDSLVLGNDVVENATWTPNLTVKNCEFGLTCGRGILATTRGKVVIENNIFKDVWGPALLIEDDCNFWFESGYTTEVIFRNNIVDNCDYIKMYEGSPVIKYSPKVMNENSNEFVHKRLLIENNEFKNPVENDCFLISLEYLRKAEIKNNTFHKPFKVNKRVVGELIEEKNHISD